MTNKNDIETILDTLESRYEASVDRLRDALTAYAEHGIRPDPKLRDEGAFSYPELRVEYDPETPPPTPARAFARLNQPGIYTSSIARPALFRAYLAEQLEHLVRDYPVNISVGASASEIPYPYVLDGSDLALDGITTAELSRWFPSTELVHIGDEIADGAWDLALDPTRPLALFDAPRTDFSLARLKHYTGTPADHFQRFVLFTNYVRYVDEFVRFAVAALRDPDSRFTSLSVPGGTYEHGDLADAEAQIAAGVWRRHQMPAYHLTTPDGDGITLVNIGVGPSNAKTICDHIAVLRPEAWLMIGHCGGLRPSQTIGDYVLAHAYLRDDHVLDDVLPVEIPIPAIAEVQTAMFEAALTVTGEDEDSVKKRLRTGTVVT
ncbi:MAG: AMP nucleosidase, partial [Sphingomicrobium sp.]